MPDGQCHICGNVGALSFEHVPPRSAFNDRPIIRIAMEKVMRDGLDVERTGKTDQRGSGAFSLCHKCNNDTGGWYARAFADWCHDGYDILERTNGGSTGFQIDAHDIYPLRVLKQIVTMFFSVNSPDFAGDHPDLVKFVLDKEHKYLNPRYRVAAYFNPIGGLRRAPLSTLYDIFSRRRSYFSEIAHFPFGYVLAIDSELSDDRLFDITHFSRHEYSERRWVTMWLPVLATHMPWPGDYRPESQIRRESDQQLG
jgi:hypothetical protein